MAETKSGLNLENLISLDEAKILEIFDHDYQNKFIKVLLINDIFFLDVLDIVVPQYFDDYQRILVSKIINYYTKNSVSPDFSDLKRVIKIEEINTLKKEHLIGLIDKISEIHIKSDKPIIDTAMTFFKKRAMADALYKMAGMWDKDDFENMVQPLSNALKAGQNKKNEGLNYLKDIKKTLGENSRNPVEVMDGIDSEIGGGMSKFELGLIIASSGSGKSMLLVAMAKNSIIKAIEKKKKRNVLYISLELAEEYIGKRFNSAFTAIPLKDQVNFPDAIEENAEEIMDNEYCQLLIKYFPTRTLTISGLKAYLDGLARNQNFKPDIIYLDYADIMDSSAYNKEHRLALQTLYQDLRGIAGLYSCPLVTASQTNRGSNKEMFIKLEDISEAFSKIAESDVVWGIGVGETGEKDEDGKPITLKNLKKATLGFLKNRMGSDGFYKNMNFDTSNVQLSIIDDSLKQSVKNNVENNLKDFSAKTSQKTASESINDILARQNQENDSKK